jgi:hypothetical protein
MSWVHPRTWLPEAITAAKLNVEVRDNFDALKNPPHDEYAPAYAAGNLISTSSASFVTMTGFELELETGGGDVLIILNVNIEGAAFFDIEVNNQRVGGTDGVMATSATGRGAILLIWLLTDIEAQTLNIVAKWKTSSSASVHAYAMPYFSAREIS